MRSGLISFDDVGSVYHPPSPLTGYRTCRLEVMLDAQEASASSGGHGESAGRLSSPSLMTL